MRIAARLEELRPAALRNRIYTRLVSVESTLARMEGTMATLVQVANEVKDAVNARIDREIAKGQEALAAKQAELDALIAAEDAEDVAQNSEIARLQAEVAGQTEAVQILESIKNGVNADMNGDGGLVVPDQTTPDVEPAPAEPVVEPTPEAPADTVVENPAVVEEPQTQTTDGEVVDDGTVVQP